MRRGSKGLKPLSVPRILGRRPKSTEAIPLAKKVLRSIKDFFMFKIYYPSDSLVNRYVERTKRSLAFARFGWLNYDFDAANLFDLMAFKLERVHKCLINGHAYQHPKDMKKLLEAISLCKRLYNEEYDQPYFKLHEEKWGKLKMKSTPASRDEKGNILTYSMDFSRPKAVTEEQKKEERRESRRDYKRAERDRLRDFDKLNEIFKNYASSWWD